MCTENAIKLPKDNFSRVLNTCDISAFFSLSGEEGNVKSLISIHCDAIRPGQFGD